MPFTLTRCHFSGKFGDIMHDHAAPIGAIALGSLCLQEINVLDRYRTWTAKGQAETVGVALREYVERGRAWEFETRENVGGDVESRVIREAAGGELWIKPSY